MRAKSLTATIYRFGLPGEYAEKAPVSAAKGQILGMEQGRYGAYVLAAYLVSALVIAGLTAFAALRARRSRRRLGDAEKKRVDG